MRLQPQHPNPGQSQPAITAATAILTNADDIVSAPDMTGTSMVTAARKLPPFTGATRYTAAAQSAGNLHKHTAQLQPVLAARSPTQTAASKASACPADRTTQAATASKHRSVPATEMRLVPMPDAGTADAMQLMAPGQLAAASQAVIVPTKAANTQAINLAATLKASLDTAPAPRESDSPAHVYKLPVARAATDRIPAWAPTEALPGDQESDND